MKSIRRIILKVHLNKWDFLIRNLGLKQFPTHEKDFHTLSLTWRNFSNFYELEMSTTAEVNDKLTNMIFSWAAKD